MKVLHILFQDCISCDHLREYRGKPYCYAVTPHKRVHESDIWVIQTWCPLKDYIDDEIYPKIDTLLREIDDDGKKVHWTIKAKMDEEEWFPLTSEQIKEILSKNKEWEFSKEELIEIIEDSLAGETITKEESGNFLKEVSKLV